MLIKKKNVSVSQKSPEQQGESWSKPDISLETKQGTMVAGSEWLQKDEASEAYIKNPNFIPNKQHFMPCEFQFY